MQGDQSDNSDAAGLLVQVEHCSASTHGPGLNAMMQVVIPAKSDLQPPVAPPHQLMLGSRGSWDQQALLCMNAAGGHDECAACLAVR